MKNIPKIPIIIGMGAYALMMSLIYDIEIFEFSLKIPWATMVSNYVFWVGSSVGLCMVSSLGLVFGLDRYHQIVKRGLFMALEGLRPYLHKEVALDRLESRIYRLLPLQRLGLSLDSEGADIKWARIFGTLACVSGLLAYTVESTLFAHTEARALWYGALIPVDFYLGACLCGFAWTMVLEIVTHKVKGDETPSQLNALFLEMSDILALLLSIEILFIAYKMGHGLFDPAKGKTIMLLLKGPYSPAFWGVEIAIGLVLPIVILLYSVRRKKTTGLMVVSGMVLIGYFVKRIRFCNRCTGLPGDQKRSAPILSDHYGDSIDSGNNSRPFANLHLGREVSTVK